MRSDNLNKELILKDLKKDAPNIVTLDSIGSTNSYILENLDKLTPNTFVLAEQQTAGRGRMGRDWQSPPGSNIAMSMYWQFSGEISQLSGLSIVVGIAVANALIELGVKDVGLKWPNDIYWREQKLGGILVETQHNGGMVNVVIGIGLNVRNVEKIRRFIEQPCVDIETALGIAVDRNKVAAMIITKLMGNLEEFVQDNCALDRFIVSWQQLDVFKGCLAELAVDNNKDQENTLTKGIVRGINGKGALSIEDPQTGSMQYIHNSCSTIRKI